MGKRVYKFKLPLHIMWLNLPQAAARLIVANLWNLLPRKLAIKLNKAIDERSAVDLTEEDLESISDEVWPLVAYQLELEWSRH